MPPNACTPSTPTACRPNTSGVTWVLGAPGPASLGASPGATQGVYMNGIAGGRLIGGSGGGVGGGVNGSGGLGTCGPGAGGITGPGRAMSATSGAINGSAEGAMNGTCGRLSSASVETTVLETGVGGGQQVGALVSPNFTGWLDPSSLIQREKERMQFDANAWRITEVNKDFWYVPPNLLLPYVHKLLRGGPMAPRGLQASAL